MYNNNNFFPQACSYCPRVGRKLWKDDTYNASLPPPPIAQ